MEEREWIELNVLALGDWFAAVGGRSPRGRLIELDGVVAAVSPAVAGRSVFNSVAYTDAAALAEHYEEIAAAYAEAGCAWTVWVPSGDEATATMLDRAGHTLDAQPRAMGAELAGVEEPDLGAIEWTAEGSSEELFTINDRAYGWVEGTWRAGLGALPDPCFIYMARVEGDPASTVLSTDHPGLDGGPDCSVWCVGTLEADRGMGLASALMRRAMFDACRRGCATTTLQATKLGRAVYERVGYRDFGPLQMWELRPPELAGQAQPKPAA
jgi:ribosomal protein S18 acetylase RimI-like enzyme